MSDRKKRRIRDIYGNWVWEDTASEKTSEYSEIEKKNDNVKLGWRDFFALAIASLQTIFLPLVILIIVLFILAALFARGI